MYKLGSSGQREINGKPHAVRTYRNSLTGTEISTYNLYTDKAGNKWWTFEDLFSLPFIRQMAAKKVVDLYGHGLMLEDVLAHTAELKAWLKSTDVDKYERAYAKVLELETLSNSMADPVKQCMGLCTVYILLNDEAPDVYHQGTQNVKMSNLAMDLEAQGFFLNWWTVVMLRSGALLRGISQIASSTTR